MAPGARLPASLLLKSGAARRMLFSYGNRNVVNVQCVEK